jgi:hypothetical protein
MRLLQFGQFEPDEGEGEDVIEALLITRFFGLCADGSGVGTANLCLSGVTFAYQLSSCRVGELGIWDITAKLTEVLQRIRRSGYRQAAPSFAVPGAYLPLTRSASFGLSPTAIFPCIRAILLI